MSLIYLDFPAALNRYIQVPKITSDSAFFATNDNDIHLTCHITMDHSSPYNAAFYHQGKRLETNDYITISDMQHEPDDTTKSHFNLTITNTDQARDEGEYTCTVIDYHNNTNSKIEAIKFVTDPVIVLNVTNPIITLDKGKKQAVFLIEYTAFPSATFFMYNPNDEKISSDMDVMNRVKYDVQIDDKKVKFIVKYPDINDFGTYTLVATTVGESFNKTLKLIVNGELIRIFNLN